MRKPVTVILFSLGLCLNLLAQTCTVINTYPPNSSTINTLTPTLRWGVTDFVNCGNCIVLFSQLSETLRVATDQQMSNIVFYSAGNTGHQHTIPGNILQNNAIYWWNVTYSHSVSCYGGPGSNCGSNTNCFASSTPWSFRASLYPNPPSNLSALAVSSGKIELNWTDNSDNEEGFELERSDDFGLSWFLRIYTSQNIISYSDSGLTPGTIYYYRVRAIHVYGSSPYSNTAFDTTFPPIGIFNIGGELPGEYSLYNNYPNPFNPVTKIRFSLPLSTYAKLVVYDMLGREIETLVNQDLQPGTYEVEWPAGNYPSGVYYYRLSAGDYIGTKKMVLIK